LLTENYELYILTNNDFQSEILVTEDFH